MVQYIFITVNSGEAINQGFSLVTLCPFSAPSAYPHSQKRLACEPYQVNTLDLLSFFVLFLLLD